MTLKLAIILVTSCVFAITNAQFTKERLCSSSRHHDECTQLQRGNSEVNCVIVQDAVECAQRIMNGTAEFGIFTAENAFHIASLRTMTELTVIKELRHLSRVRENFDYQSVVIVRSDHVDGTRNLKGMDFCHPGLHQNLRHERWTEAFLKHFEREVVPYDCEDGTSPAEIEAAALSNFFNAACRPGIWSHNSAEDESLKQRFPRLCELCDNAANCSYEQSSLSSHQLALQCMQKSTNGVAYVALQEAHDFFQDNADTINDYKFLCPNGTYQNIDGNVFPCVWLKQPWTVIVSNINNAISLSTRMRNWQFGSTLWETSLNSILTEDSKSVFNVQNIVPLIDYINAIRPIPAPLGICSTTATWCTHSYEEKDKCEVLRTVALTLGIRPLFECSNPRSDTVSCISDVSTGKADLLGIDSNYGFLARHVYNLTAALYEETEVEKYSSVIALIKNSDAERITRFEDFRGKRACFPEFGGIASIEFINIAKQRRIFSHNECNFGQLLGEYFSDSCLPGSRSIFHDPSATNPESLCTLCQTQLYSTTTTTQAPVAALHGNVDDEEDYDGELRSTTDGIEGNDDDENIPFVPNRAVNCAAATSNRFYGTRGALACLHEVGEIAVLEHQNLNQHAWALNLVPDDFRIICRNGSLANSPGFDVDANCFLTTIVDGEIVIRRNNPKNLGIINALVSLDTYLQTDPDFKLYNIFSGEKNLLFEDSALGLVSPNSTSLSSSVENYIKLFQDVENCISETGSAPQITFNLLLSFTLIIFTIFIRF